MSSKGPTQLGDVECATTQFLRGLPVDYNRVKSGSDVVQIDTTGQQVVQEYSRS